MTEKKKILASFMSLPSHVQMEVLRKHNLVKEDDGCLTDTELFTRCLNRANENNTMIFLWDSIKQAVAKEDERDKKDAQSTKKPFKFDEKHDVPFQMMTINEMSEALKDKHIPNEADCLILADRLKDLLSCKKYIYELEAARQYRPDCL
jgi:GTPase-associated adaptor domain